MRASEKDPHQLDGQSGLVRLDIRFSTKISFHNFVCVLCAQIIIMNFLTRFRRLKALELLS